MSQIFHVAHGFLDWVGPELCGNPNRAEQVCLNKSAGTSRHYLSTSVNGRSGPYVAVALEPTGLECPLIGASNQTYRGLGVVNANNYSVEASIELQLTTPVVPNPVTHATLLTNGKAAQAGHQSFTMAPVATTANE